MLGDVVNEETQLRKVLSTLDLTALGVNIFIEIIFIRLVLLSNRDDFESWFKRESYAQQLTRPNSGLLTEKHHFCSYNFY